MALYTPLEMETLRDVAGRYGLGDVLGARGIPQGSINTNYRVDTDRGRYFVRHSTVRSEEDLAFEASVLALAASARLSVAKLVLTPGGAAFIPLAGGRLSVFEWLEGEELPREALTAEHLRALGSTLGALHRAMDEAPATLSRTNPYGLACVDAWLQGLHCHADPEVAAAERILRAALARAEAHRQAPESTTVIHADLFIDNVKWLGPDRCTFFDFEMACRAPAGLDVAITLNAWCFEGADYREALCRAFVGGYLEQRSLSASERENLYGHALFGAVRYTASRIRDFHLSPLPPEQLAPKDFRTYLARVQRLERLGPEGFQALLGL